MSRRRRYEYLLSALPALESLGSAPPLGKLDFLERVGEAKGPIATISILLLSDDLMQREALLAQEITADQTDMAILASGSIEDDSDLPPYLRDEDESFDNARLAVDALWRRYFQQAHKVARRQGSPFLQRWVGYEVGLRNALVNARAQSLDLDPMAYLVTPELGDPDLDCGSLLSAWSAATDPLAAQEVLDKARWEWLEENGRWFSFQADELEAYAAKLMLLLRWRRISTDKPVEVGS